MINIVAAFFEFIAFAENLVQHLLNTFVYYC